MLISPEDFMAMNAFQFLTSQGVAGSEESGLGSLGSGFGSVACCDSFTQGEATSLCHIYRAV